MLFHRKTRCLLIAAVAGASFAFAQAARAATEEKLSEPEVLKLNECMAMADDVLSRDSQCSVIMKKASVTKTDIEKMRRCESKLDVDVTKDPDCAAMIKKHPDLVRGHGALMPEQPSPSAKPPGK